MDFEAWGLRRSANSEPLRGLFSIGQVIPSMTNPLSERRWDQAPLYPTSTRCPGRRRSLRKSGRKHAHISFRSASSQ
eukprot:14827164-Alexandrium_andersonii.AAC.1